MTTHTILLSSDELALMRDALAGHRRTLIAALDMARLINPNVGEEHLGIPEYDALLAKLSASLRERR
jgi:hypothetical protein